MGYCDPIHDNTSQYIVVHVRMLGIPLGAIVSLPTVIAGARPALGIAARLEVLWRER